MAKMTRVLSCSFLTALVFGSACGGDSGEPAQAEEAEDAGTALTSDDQTPPMGAKKIEAWLKTGAYKEWSCEPMVHESRDPSPHGYNRICSNELISSAAKGKGNWPQGSAGVKELYASADGTVPIGYAVYLKTAEDSAAGANWYWYERVPLDHGAPHDGDGVVADGLGDSGPAKTICVGCHVASGADAAHTPTPGGRDQVYTPVTP